MNIRIVFMGSPEFARPTLQSLAGEYDLVGVITQPDRKSGRGRILTPPPVKALAAALGLPVYQPARLRNPDALAQIARWDPEVIVVAAYGKILRKEVLQLPKYGCINVHASLLPRWRGASPVHHAILHGDSQTGITIMKMDAGLDTGPILSQSAIRIFPEETTERLGQRLALTGADLLLETLPGYLNGEIRLQPQDDDLSTYAPMLKKRDGRLDFSKTAEQLARQVRAFTPWPGTFFDIENGTLKVRRARASRGEAPVGKRLVLDGFPAVAAAAGILLLEEVQPPGKKSMSGQVYLSGARNWTTI